MEGRWKIMEVDDACGGIFDVGELSNNDELANGQKGKTLGEIGIIWCIKIGTVYDLYSKRRDYECKKHKSPRI